MTITEHLKTLPEPHRSILTNLTKNYELSGAKSIDCNQAFLIYGTWFKMENYPALYFHALKEGRYSDADRILQESGLWPTVTLIQPI